MPLEEVTCGFCWDRSDKDVTVFTEGLDGEERAGFCSACFKVDGGNGGLKEGGGGKGGSGAGNEGADGVTTPLVRPRTPAELGLLMLVSIETGGGPDSGGGGGGSGGECLER